MGESCLVLTEIESVDGFYRCPISPFSLSARYTGEAYGII